MNASRRRFLASAFPAIVPVSVFGQNAPSNHIRVAQIGCGRIARASEFPGVLGLHDSARFVAVCDVDAVRLDDGKRFVEEYYSKRLGAGKFESVKTYRNYKEMLADKSIDAVCISTPDHWHAQPAMEAAIAGKDVYLQKPASLTIREGRQMADVLARTGRILQIGSQQRSAPQFRLACELVRNGRIGAVKEIYIGLPEDPAGGDEREMPVSAALDYDAWIGSTPMVPYTVDRVHPQSPDIKARYARPGWLRCEQFGAGMITGWGAHHIDTAHWAMGLDAPVEIAADARFPAKGLWDVHGPYHVRMRYPNGAVMYLSDKFENGIRFVGEEGWIWVTRGVYREGDPPAGKRIKALDAHDPRILRAGVKDGELRLHKSPSWNHHLDWLESVRTRKQPAAPAETGHRSCSTCLVAHAAMKLGRTLRWDAKTERFVNDEEADRMLERPQRAPYGSGRVRL